MIANNDIEGLGLDESVPITLRAKAFSDLAQYIAPRRRASDISIGENKGLVDVLREISEASESNVTELTDISQSA